MAVVEEHREIASAEVHTVYRKVFADEAARLADVGPYKTVELNLKAIQEDTAVEYRLTAITPTWTAVGGGGGGITSPFWPIQQQVSQDYTFAQGGSQSISIPGLNLSEGILPGRCMCQIYCLIMGANASGGEASAFELYLSTITMLADTGSDEPWERLDGTDAVALVQEGVPTTSKVTCALNDLTSDPLTQLEMVLIDTDGAEGAWTATLLVTRSEFIPIP